MIIIHTALYFEAEKAIKHYGLREIKDVALPVRLFKNGEGSVALLVSGTGMTNAIICVSSALTYLRAGRGDLFINFGIAGAAHGSEGILKTGEIVRAVKCSSRNGRPFYPDVIYKSSFKLAEVVTVLGPLDEISHKYGENGLPAVLDMELHGAFTAANMFLGPEALIGYKVVSDMAEETRSKGGLIDRNDAETVVSLTWDGLFEEIDRIGKEAAERLSEEESAKTIPDGAEEAFGELCERLRLTFADREILKNRIRRDSLLGIPAGENVERLLKLLKEHAPKTCEERELFFKNEVMKDPFEGGDPVD